MLKYYKTLKSITPQEVSRQLYPTRSKKRWSRYGVVRVWACKCVKPWAHSATEFWNLFETWPRIVGEYSCKWDHAGGSAVVRRGLSLAYSQLQPAQARLHMVNSRRLFHKVLETALDLRPGSTCSRQVATLLLVLWFSYKGQHHTWSLREQTDVLWPAEVEKEGGLPFTFDYVSWKVIQLLLEAMLLTYRC